MIKVVRVGDSDDIYIEHVFVDFKRKRLEIKMRCLDFQKNGVRALYPYMVRKTMKASMPSGCQFSHVEFNLALSQWLLPKIPAGKDDKPHPITPSFDMFWRGYPLFISLEYDYNKGFAFDLVCRKRFTAFRVTPEAFLDWFYGFADTLYAQRIEARLLQKQEPNPKRVRLSASSTPQIVQSDPDNKGVFV